MLYVNEKNGLTNIGKLIKQDDSVHYYASSFANWSTHSDLTICLEKQKSADRPLGKKVKGKMYFPPVDVYIVPHPAKTPYEIENFIPVGVDAQIIASMRDEVWFDE